MEIVAEAIITLKRAGWSIGDTAFVGPGGGLSWFVAGLNGENLIRAFGAPRGEAWRRATEQAKGVGMGGRRSIFTPEGFR